MNTEQKTMLEEHGIALTDTYWLTDVGDTYGKPAEKLVKGDIIIDHFESRSTVVALEYKGKSINITETWFDVNSVKRFSIRRTRPGQIIPVKIGGQIIVSGRTREQAKNKCTIKIDSSFMKGIEAHLKVHGSPMHYDGDIKPFTPSSNASTTLLITSPECMNFSGKRKDYQNQTDTQMKTKKKVAHRKSAAVKKLPVMKTSQPEKPIDILNQEIRDVTTRKSFDNFRVKVDQAGLVFVKRQGNVPLKFKQHAISKRRNNQPMAVFETKDGEISKAVLSVLSRFVAIGHR